MPQSNDRSLVRGLTEGALAGIAATWVMGQITSYMYKQESEEARRAENEARGGKMAFGVAAEKAAEVAGTNLTEEERKSLGKKIHWALGMGAGAVYGASRTPGRGASIGRGLSFGTGFYLLVDEIGNPVLGLTAGPGAFPWEAHARGFVGHLVFGATAEVLLSLME